MYLHFLSFLNTEMVQVVWNPSMSFKRGRLQGIHFMFHAMVIDDLGPFSVSCSA